MHFFQHRRFKKAIKAIKSGEERSFDDICQIVGSVDHHVVMNHMARHILNGDVSARYERLKDGEVVEHQDSILDFEGVNVFEEDIRVIFLKGRTSDLNEKDKK